MSFMREFYEEMHGGPGEVYTAHFNTFLIFPDKLVRCTSSGRVDTVDGWLRNLAVPDEEKVMLKLKYG